MVFFAIVMLIFVMTTLEKKTLHTKTFLSLTKCNAFIATFYFTVYLIKYLNVLSFVYSLKDT